MGRQLAFNPELLGASKSKVSHLKQITVTDIYDGASKQFHPEGLFSTDFGRIGSPERMTTLGVIDYRIKVFHPLIYTQIKKLKNLYEGIMSGKAYARWDAKLKDFVRSNEMEGDTGYSFFMKYFKDIKFKETKSDQRKLRIDLIQKYEKDLLRDTLVVIPAGLRDVITDDDGRTSYLEINDLYKRIIAVSNTIIDSDDVAVHDVARWNLQRTLVEVYEYLFNIVYGKDKHIQKKWASRRVFNGTRNVLTSMPTHSADLDSITTPDTDMCMVGIYQQSKAMLPLMVHTFTKRFPSKVVDAGSGTAMVFDVKTGKPKSIDVSRKQLDLWTTSDGVNKLLNRFGDVKKRHHPVYIDGSHFAMIYRDDKAFRLIDALEYENGEYTDEQKAKMRPVTWVELLYVLMHKTVKRTYGIITRYPVTGFGSTYPAKVYLKSTVKSTVLEEVGPDLQPTGEVSNMAAEFPIIDDDINYFDSIAVHTDNLTNLGAD